MTSEENAKDYLLMMDEFHSAQDELDTLTGLLNQHAEEAKTEQRKELNQLIKGVAHIGVDFGYGKYVLEQEYIDLARKLYESNA